MCMKINRLLEITVLLLNKRIIKAKELADRFQVSTRTIYRDVENLSLAGIPVYMSKGKGGGISLLEDFSVNKAMLTKEDKESLILALKTLQVTKYPETEAAIEKIGSLFKEETLEDWVQVDFSQWGSDPNEGGRFALIKEAIIRKRIMGFDYINTFGDKSHREIEAMKLIYKGQAWYLYGYCRRKQDFRIFRLSRMKHITLTTEGFQRRPFSGTIPIDQPSPAKKDVTLKLRFKPYMVYRVYDDFPETGIVRLEDGTCVVTVSYPEDEWVYGYILSFGAAVEVLEPPHIRRIIEARHSEAAELYKTNI